MNKFILFTSALLTTISSLFGVGSFYLQRLPSGQLIISYGDVHNIDDHLGEGTAAKHINIIFNEFKAVKTVKQFAFILEQSPDTLMNPEKAIFIAPTIAGVTRSCRDLMQSGQSPLLMVAEEERSTESDFIYQAYELISTITEQHTTTEQLLKYHKLEHHPLVLMSTFKSMTQGAKGTFQDLLAYFKRIRVKPAAEKFTLKHLNEYLERTQAHLEKVRELHSENAEVFHIIQERIDRFIASRSAIKEFFGEAEQNEIFAYKVLAKFSQCSTLDSLLSLLETYHKIFLLESDFLYADVMLFHRLLYELKSGSNVAIYCGSYRAYSLAEMIKKMGGETVKKCSTEAIDKVLFAVYMMFGKPNDPLSFENQLREATNDFMVSQMSYKEEPFKKQCLHCFSHKDVLKKCGRCMMVYYCDAICQKKSWPEHKKICIKQ